MHRRRMLKVALVSSFAGAAIVNTKPARAESRPVASDDPRELADAVSAGVGYFITRCKEQLPLVKKLQAAIESGDVARAQQAYIDSRPPYEEIETISPDFASSDRDIDARPYAFEGGELDENFRGFHKVEALLFAYKDLEAAKPFAKRLVSSIERLGTELRERRRFTAKGQFDGMVALATEVAAKKVSSEEETWSDQSLLIFRHNWIGIHSQYAPFASILGETDRTVRAYTEAHNHAMGLVSPHFREGEAGGTPYSKIGIVERRSMADASNRLRDALIQTRELIGV